MMILILLLLLLLSSCPAESYGYERIPTPSAYMLPVLEDLVLIDNGKITISFDRPVVIRDMTLEYEKVEKSSVESKLFTIRLPYPVPYGEERRLRLTVEDRKTGFLSRLSIPLMGINRSQAKVLMTEISVKGTETSPDRVELTVLESGTTGSLTITDGIIGEAGFSYTLPDFKVSKGDVIVIHFSAPHKGEDIIRIGNKRIFNIDTNEKLSFLSTNGAVILYSHTNGKGKIIDAFLYTKSDATGSGGWGNEKTRLSAESLEARLEWKGRGFQSDKTTSTRVFARWFPYSDSNTAGDWYLTATRSSTFGYTNDNKEYVEPDEEEKE